MAQQRGRRTKRRSQPSQSASVPAPTPPDGRAAMSRGYERSRRRDDEVRANLEPLAPGERPTAVTVGAIAALLIGLANLVALLVSFDPDESRKIVGTALPVPLLLLIAWGMWRAKYWAVLGMQTILGLTIVGFTLAGVQALNLRAVVVVVAVLVPAVTLFWFLIKAMARIQMPGRPGQQPPR